LHTGAVVVPSLTHFETVARAPNLALAFVADCLVPGTVRHRWADYAALPVGELTGEIEALAAPAIKVDETVRAVQHYVETENLRFATLALQMGEQSLDDLAQRYRGLLRRIEKLSKPV
jgi:hypothetical protein